LKSAAAQIFQKNVVGWIDLSRRNRFRRKRFVINAFCAV
jgi:hypothetical protein